VINKADFLASVEEHLKESQRKSEPDYRKVVFCDKHLGVKRFPWSDSIWTRFS